MKEVKIKQVIWLFVVLSAIIIMISTHLTLTHAVGDKPKMGINGNHVSQIDPYKTDYQDFSYPLSFKNTDFEYPRVIQGTPVVDENYPNLGWKTTDNYGVIEFWNKPDLVNHASGQFIEINAANQASVYQDIYGQFVPGQKIVYKFNHRARKVFSIPELRFMYEGVRFMAGAPGFDYNQNELSHVVAPGSFGSDLFKVTDHKNWVQNTGSFTIPQNVGNTLRVAFVADSHENISKSEGNFLDDVYFSTATPASFSNTINIKENRTILNTISRGRIVEVSNMIERVNDNSDIEWRNQNYEVILPVGATIPTEANAKYNDGTTEKLVVTKTSNNSFTINGFSKNFFDSVDITYNSNFGNINDRQAVVTGNYKFTTSIVEGCEVAYNVWGIDYADIINEYQLDFNLNGADSGTQPKRELYLVGEKTIRPSVEDFTKRGHTFNGWAVTAGEYSRLWDFVNDKMPSNNKTLYANWVRNSYDMKFVTNSIETPNIDQQAILFGEKAQEPITPIKKGHTFVEWNRKANLTGNAWRFATDFMSDQTITLYAKYEPSKYNVNFMYNDVRGTYKQQQVIYETKITEPNIPKKEDYKFIGWNTNADATGSYWDFSSNYIEENDLILYAIWEKSIYDIDYGNTEYPSIDTICEETVPRIPDPIREGYTFIGWTDDLATNKLWDFKNDMMPCNDLKLYAVWEINSYDANFYLNDGTNVIHNTQKVMFGNKINEPITPERSGYVFINWKTKTNEVWNSDEPIGAVNINLYANWQPKYYNIYFDANGAVDYPTLKQELVTGSLVGKPSSPNLQNNKFVGWTTSKNDKSTLWNFNIDRVQENDITLYALWEKEEYPLTFDENYNNKRTRTMNVFDTLINQPTNPTRLGYKFSGWNTSADGNGVNWDFANDKMPANEMTLYANWTQNLMHVYFDANGATDYPSITQELAYNQLVGQPTAPVLFGHKFIGWTTQKNDSNTIWNFGSNRVENDDITLYALWDKQSYTMTFDDNYSNTRTKNNYNYQDKITSPKTPTRKGFTFKSWNLNSDGSGKVWNFEEDLMPDSDVTLYAQWEINSYNVYFDGNGAIDYYVEPQQIEYNRVINKPIDPTKTGYKFMGWTSIKDDETTIWDFNNNAVTDQDMTLYALWIQGANLITFDENYNDVRYNQTKKYGELITIPNDPKRIGYTFSGWNTMANSSGKMWDFYVDTMPEYEVILYAIWEPNYVNVHFDGNTNHEYSQPSQKLIYDDFITEPVNVPIRQGYRHIGWSTERDILKTKWKFNRYKVKETDMTLYALWIPYTYEVTFDYNFNGQSYTSTYKYASFIDPQVDPVRPGYTFNGWNTVADGTGIDWDFANDTVPSRNLVLYANWIPNQYKVTFIDEVVLNTAEYNVDSKIQNPNKITKDGYEFTGWKTETGKVWDFEKDLMPANDLELFATWGINTLEVSFDLNGANDVIPTKQSVEFGKLISEPVEPIHQDTLSLDGRKVKILVKKFGISIMIKCQIII